MQSVVSKISGSSEQCLSIYPKNLAELVSVFMASIDRQAYLFKIAVSLVKILKSGYELKLTLTHNSPL